MYYEDNLMKEHYELEEESGKYSAANGALALLLLSS